MHKIKSLFDGVFLIDGKVATINLVRGKRVYDEELLTIDKIEYRFWNPYRSKLSAAVLNGLKTFAIKSSSTILYLGAASGTTVSHVSDIVGDEGRVYAVEISERSMRDLMDVCSLRHNMLPILEDASYPERYAEVVEKCDVIYQDVSARNQAEILKKNSIFLKKNGIAYFIIKSQSIDISKAPTQVYKEALESISDTFEVVESFGLEPYDSMHLFTVLRKII